MSNLAVKITLYIVFAAATAFFGWRSYRALRAEEIRHGPPQFSVGITPETVDASNVVAGATNAAPNGTNTAVTNVAAADGVADDEAPPNRRAFGPIVINGLLCLGALLGLGLLAGRDVSRVLGGKAVDALGFDFDEAPGAPDPDYEHAENVWKDGHPLEAIQLMRDYLERHPREQYVALRIAEIYEKDLRNPLAAALEYEQVLTHPLTREKWGKTALQLCNLYTGPLHQTDKGVALLRRIVKEFGDTKAATKARERLAQFDGGAAPEPEAGGDLPAGFRPRK